MKRLWLAVALASCLPAAGALGGNPTLVPGYAQRSISSSRQFIIYCPDVRVRLAVTGFVETAKSAVLETLGLADSWKLPIVVNLQPAATADPHRPASQFYFITTDDGTKIEVEVALREGDLKAARFPQQIIRAVLTEIAYRTRIPEGGARYEPPPAWLVEAIAERLHARVSGQAPHAALFRQLIETGKLPKVSDFLESNTEVMDNTSRTLYAACSWSLVEMLTELPGGRASLARLVRGLPDAGASSVGRLLAAYPSLGGNEAALEKWWTLGLARFSAADRFLALSVEETNNRLAPLLTFEVVTNPKKGTKTRFGFAEYREFVKLKSARPVLLSRAVDFAMLLPSAHPLMRPVVVEYQRLANELALGNAKGSAQSLEEVEHYRGLIVERMGRITDYLNWFEATQMPGLSGAFDDYLKAARAAESAAPMRRNDPLTRYIDQVEREFQ